MKVFDGYVKFLLLGIISLPCFINVVLWDSWQERACVLEYKWICRDVSKNYTEPYCVTSDINSINRTFDCMKLPVVNNFSPNDNEKKMSDLSMKDILSKYCSLLYDTKGTRIYFAKPNNQTTDRDWSQTIDSRQSLFLYALCSSFKDENWKMPFLMVDNKQQEVQIWEVFSWNLAKLLKLQQIAGNGKNLCSLDDDITLNDCDMSIYATKIYEAIMTDLYKIKYAQVLNVDAFENFKVEEKVKDFMTGYNLSDKTYKELKNLYPKTLAILESNQMFYKKVLETVKILDNSKLASEAKEEKKCLITWNMMTWVDFIACALHSSQGNKFALTPSFVSLLYNEVLHYRLFVMYYQVLLDEKKTTPDLGVKGKDLLDLKSNFEWYSQKQLEATKKVQHDFEDFNMTYPLHIWLLMYTEKVEKFRNNSLSKLITSFYSLSEKLQNVQQPSY